MIDFPRVVLCFHGCLEPYATDLLSGQIGMSDWEESKKRYDWLGRGIYFWEYAPRRAMEWAKLKAAERGGKPAVIGAVVQLDRCFDLTESEFTDRLSQSFQTISNAYQAAGTTLPENKGRDSDRKARFRDCIVINHLLQSVTNEAERFSSVRGSFSEGEPVYEGAMIRQRSHIQIAVRDRSCIKGIFRPTFLGAAP